MAEISRSPDRTSESVSDTTPPAVMRAAWAVPGLVLLFLSAGAGAIAFGAVRVSEIGPLAVLLFLALAGFGVRILRSDAGALPVPPAIVPMLLFLLYAGALQFFSVPAYPARVKFLMLCTGPAAYLLWTVWAGHGGRARAGLVALLLISLAIGVYAIRQHHEGSRLVLHMVRPPGYGMRASGTYACPNHFAHLAIVAMCAGAALAFTRGAGRWVRILAGTSAAVLLYPLFLSHSRAAALGLGAGLGVMALLAASRKGLRWLGLAAVAAPAALTAAGWALWSFSPIWRARFGEALRGLHNGLDFRPICWKSTLEMIRLRPWWGWGGGSFAWAEPAFQAYGPDRVAVYAHNEPLHLTMEYGLIGFGLIALASVVWLARAVRLAGRSSDRVTAGVTIGAVGVVVASFVHALFDFNLHIYANSHTVLLAMGAAMALHSRDGALRRIELRTLIRRRALGIAIAVAGLTLAYAMTRTTVSHWLVMRGDAAQDLAKSREQQEHAIAIYRRAIRWNPGNPTAWRELGRMTKNLADVFRDAQEREDWIEESFAFYRRALRGNPLDPATLHGLAQLHRMRGEQEAALLYLQEMVRLHPKRSYFHGQLAFQYERLKRYEEALEAFEAAAALGDREIRFSIRRMRAKLQARPPAPASAP